MTFSPFNRQNISAQEGPNVQRGIASSGGVVHQAQGGLAAPAAAPVAGFGAPVNPFAAINFGPRGKPDLPHGDSVIELVPGDATRDPGAETGRWFYAPPGKSRDAKLAFAFKVLESSNPANVIDDYYVHRQKMQVNSQGSDTIVYRKIGNILFALVGIAVPTAEDKANLGASWDEFSRQGTVGGQSLLGLKCRVRVYDGKNIGPNGRPWLEYDFRPL